MDERTKPVLVTGATGSTGSALVTLLRQREVPVRVMVRRKADVTRVDAIPESVVVADFDDVESLAAAVRGISRAYLVTPSSEKAEAQQNRFAEIAAKAGVEQLVKLSQFAADEASLVRFLRATRTGWLSQASALSGQLWLNTTGCPVPQPDALGAACTLSPGLHVLLRQVMAAP